MPEISPALLLTEYWSAFPSGMTLLSQMPPFLRFVFWLFLEDKVMRTECIHQYCPHLAVCKGHYPWRRLCKNQWNCRSIRCIVYKFQCQGLNPEQFFGILGDQIDLLSVIPNPNSVIDVENVVFGANSPFLCYISILWHTSNIQNFHNTSEILINPNFQPCRDRLQQKKPKWGA